MSATFLTKTRKWLYGPKNKTVCPTCGQPEPLPKINADLFKKEFENKWLQKGFRNTVLGLFLNPADSVKKFIKQDRSLLINPVTYLFMALSFVIWTRHNFPNNSSAGSLKESFFQYLAFVQLLLAVVVAFLMRYFYKSTQYNFYERLLLTTYLLAQCFIIFGLFTIAGHYLTVDGVWLDGISLLIRAIFCASAIAYFLDEPTFWGWLKGMSAYILGLLLFMPIFYLYTELLDLIN